MTRENIFLVGNQDVYALIGIQLRNTILCFRLDINKLYKL